MMNIGTGVLLQNAHTQLILTCGPALQWVELTSEHLLGSKINGFKPRITKSIESLLARFPVSLHGLELSIGSVEPLDMSYLNGLKELVAIVKPSIMSDHLVWTGAAGFRAHELLPFPYTKESLIHVSDRISRVQDFIGRQFLLENPPSSIRFEHAEYSDSDFMNELSKRSGCGLLIDLNNLYVTSENNQLSSMEFIKNINPDSVGQYHLAGHHQSKENGFLFDTHAAPVPDEVWQLFELALKKIGPRATNIEWFLGKMPFKELYEQCQKAQTYLGKYRANAA